jgi:hypothetical protein
VAVSTIPAAITYLIGQINQQSAVTSPPAGEAVAVSYGPPSTYQPDDLVVITSSERSTDQLAMIGSGATGWLLEKYLLLCTVDVFRGGDDAASCDARAWALVGAVETAVRNDPSFGGLLIVAVPSTPRHDLGWDPDEKGRRSVIEMHIACEARI